jgi:hypothetical protein
MPGEEVGSRQSIMPGQLNLMTAGRGIAHSEESPLEHPPVMHGLQLGGRAGRVRSGRGAQLEEPKAGFGVRPAAAFLASDHALSLIATALNLTAGTVADQRPSGRRSRWVNRPRSFARIHKECSRRWRL